jgi:hypothetical protein
VPGLQEFRRDWTKSFACELPKAPGELNVFCPVNKFVPVDVIGPTNVVAVVNVVSPEFDCGVACSVPPGDPHPFEVKFPLIISVLLSLPLNAKVA